MLLHPPQLESALESLSGIPDIDVTRFGFLNGGSLWAITFPSDSGNVDSLYLNVTGLRGTDLLASVSEDVSGSTLGGSFRLYSNRGGYGSSGFPIDEDGTHLGAAENGTGRSEPLAWNAEAGDVRAAVENLLPEYSSQGVFEHGGLQL